MTTTLMPRLEHGYEQGRGPRTPWGPTQVRYDYAPGIAFHSTAGHGGFKVAAHLNCLIPPYMRDESGPGWYEEDCGWAIVATCFPSAFSAGERSAAERSLRQWNPDAYEAFYERTLAPGESCVRDDLERERYARDHGLYLPIAAWGDWYDSVPNGQVGVCATLGGSREPDAPGLYLLVPKDYYHPGTDEYEPGDWPEWVDHAGTRTKVVTG